MEDVIHLSVRCARKMVLTLFYRIYFSEGLIRDAAKAP
jgi:hypothetical protein